MPRKNLIRTAEHPYHVTIRSNNREWFNLPIEQVWEICIKALSSSTPQYKVKIQAFVLMANHYHLMVWTPEANLDRFMFSLNSQISRDIRKTTGRINRIFGDRYKWSIIQTTPYYYQALKYIYQNPMKAGLIERCQDYPYSTLHSHLKGENLFSFDLFDPLLEEREDFLNWINEPFTSAENIKIAKAIRRPVYKLPRTGT